MSNKISNPDKTNYPIRMGKTWQDDEVTHLSKTEKVFQRLQKNINELKEESDPNYLVLPLIIT